MLFYAHGVYWSKPELSLSHTHTHHKESGSCVGAPLSVFKCHVRLITTQRGEREREFYLRKRKTDSNDFKKKNKKVDGRNKSKKVINSSEN